MKKLAIISVFALTALSSMGCTEVVAPTMDNTLTAYYIYQDVEQVVGAAARTATHAFVLSAYMNAANNEERQAIENKFYKYYKVRDEGDGNWRVYGIDDYMERYFVSDNKSLTESNSSWLVKRCSAIYGTISNFDSGEIIVRRTGLGTYKVIYTAASIIDLSMPNNYYDDVSRYSVSGEFNLVTDFFSTSGQEPTNTGISLTGTAVMTDSYNPNFKVTVSIPTPLELKIALADITYAVANGKMTIEVDEQLSKAHETIAVDYTRATQTVSLRYTTADGTFDGIYNK